MTKTLHRSDCRRAFKNYDKECVRCIELINGEKPRKGWGIDRRFEDQKRTAEIRAHNCEVRKCGPVCTAFEW